MTMNHLPPQAYTKETLVKAYEWLTHQNPQIKDMAINTDILISMYRKAQMHGDDFLERPSIQNFKNELKNLAGMMGEFTEPQTASKPTVAATTTNSVGASSNVVPTQNGGAVPFQTTSTQATMTQTTAQAAPTQSPQTKNTLNLNLDAKTLEMIREVKNEFNLSHENEAIRLLISTGYKKIKTIL